VGDIVNCPSCQTGTTVVSVDSSTSITVSLPTTSTSVVPVTVTFGLNTGRLDGTALLSYREATPRLVTLADGEVVPVFTGTTCALFNAETNFDATCRGFNITTGFNLWPTGSTDNTIRNGRLKFTGTVTGACVSDQAKPRQTGIQPVVDNVTLDNFDCRVLPVGAGAQAGISIGNPGVILRTTGNTHSNTTVDGIPSTALVVPGQYFAITGVPANTTVVSVDSSTQVTISNASTTTTSGNVATFYDTLFVNWTGLKILGGTYTVTTTATNATTRAFKNNGGSVTGTVQGARFSGGTAGIYSIGTTNLTIVGGIVEDTDTANGSGPITTQDGVLPANGTITLLNVVVNNARPSNVGTWKNFSTLGSPSVIGRAINPPSAAKPGSHCIDSLDYAGKTTGTNGVDWYCTPDNTWN
jgi:hypothetical protein